MPAPTTIDEAILANALGPKKVRVGNTEVEQHPLADLRDVRDETANETAATVAHFGLRFTALKSPAGG